MYFLNEPTERPLRQVVASTGNVLVDPYVTLIPDNGYSETFQAAQGLEVLLELIFGAAATGDVVIEKCADQAVTVAGTAFDTVTAAAELSKNWNSGQALTGWFRIKNTSGQTCKAYLNFRIR